MFALIDFLDIISPMQRREFIAWLLACSALRSSRAVADHHYVSANPLIVECDLSSLKEHYVPLADFYVRNHKGMPATAPGFLSIDGLVGNKLHVKAQDLKRFSIRRLNAVLECAGNTPGAGGVSNGRWEGIALSELLGAVKPVALAKYINFYGADGYSRSVPIQAIKQDGLLVTRLDGYPLRREHGFPWRAFVPGWYGMDSVKWLYRIELAGGPLSSNEDEYMSLTRDPAGDIVKEPLPRVLVRSIITSPTRESVMPTGMIVVHGLAWSGAGSIRKVELSVDNGTTWSRSYLKPSARYDWVEWHGTVDLRRRGRVELICRATDSAGNMQPAHRHPDRLDGYANNEYHHVSCIVT